MKKKILLFCSAGLMSLSLISCDGKEKKIDNNDGNEMVNVAMDKTTEKLEEVSKKNYLGFSANASVKGNYDFAIEKSFNKATDDYSGTASISSKGSIDTSIEMQANVDVDGLRKTPNADITNTESYAASKVSLKATDSEKTNIPEYPELTVDDSKETEINEEYKSYQKGLNVVNYTKVGTEEKTVGSVLTTEEVNNGAAQIITVLDAFSGKMPSLGDSSTSDSSMQLPTIPVDEESLVVIQTKTDDFFAGKITADAYVTAIDTAIADGKLFESAPLGARDTVVGLLEIAYDVNPSKYFEYTKITEKKNVTLNSSFKYDTWKNDLTTKLDAKINATDTTNPAYQLLSFIKPIVISILPQTMKLDYTLKINSDGYINGMSFDVAAKGEISGELASLISPTGNTIISYDVAFTGSFNYDFSDKTTVQTLSLPASK